MDWLAHEGLSLALRWFHIVAVITWIGHAYFFNWLDRSLEKPAGGAGGEAGTVEGQLWMVHSGGFYRVEKITTAPGKLPDVLHWFKWEAALSWISGFLLLGATYYSSPLMMVEPGLNELSSGAVTAVGFSSLIVGWLLYDQVYCRFVAGTALAVPVGWAAIVGLAWGLAQVMGGRAMYVHVGAVLGTLMVASVWVRIIPAQKALVAATAAGTTPDPTLGARAKQRSVHNNYLSLPVVFVMVSNHFATTYGHEQGWLVLGLLVGAGMGVRRLMNTQNAGAPAVALLVVAAIAATAWLQQAPSDESDALDDTAVIGSSGPGAADLTAAGNGTGAEDVALGPTGTIRGAVMLDGPAPAREAVSLPGECRGVHAGGVVVPDDVLVRDGLVQNAFVVLRGVDNRAAPAAPDTDVLIDQVGCMFTPRVVGVRVRQQLRLLNSDAVLHNVHALPEINSEFNVGMPTQGMVVQKSFKRPETMVRIKCDVHPWMGAWVGVVDHPWFDVSDDAGAFELSDVPVGTYELEVWHEVFGRVTREVEVRDGMVSDVGVSLEAG